MKHKVEEVKLANGARGLLIDVPGATVMSFQFQFRAGNRFVKSKDIYETAHIMEHMAFGPNERYRSEQTFEQDFTKNGAYHNAYTSDLSMAYEAICADFEWDRIFELQELSICKPRFSNEVLDSEKGNVRGELTGYLNNHNRVMWPRVQQALGEDVLTFNQRIKTIPAIKLSDIREHHTRTHTLNNMRFVIAGKLYGRKSEIKRRLAAWDLPQGERFEVPHDDLTTPNPILIRRKEASNLTFGLSLTIPREISDEECDAMGALNHILTGTTSSRIFGAARKKGLAYGIFSDVSVGKYSSSWDFAGEVNLETADDLFVIINREIGRVADGGLTDSEIEAAKSYALGRHQMGAQTVSQISYYYTDQYFADDKVRDYNAAPATIHRISRDCIINTAREFMKSNAWVLAGVSSGEREEIDSLSDSVAKTLAKVRSGDEQPTD